jgi:hypothetical protein
MVVDLTQLSVRTARITGQHHLQKGTPCQDYVVVARDKNSIVAAVCDGVGSVPLAHYGAELHAKEGVRLARDLVATGPQSLIDTKFLAELYVRIYTRLKQITQELNIHPADAANTFLTSTLELLIMTPDETVVLSLGDGYLRWRGELRSIEGRTARFSSPGIVLPPPLLTTALLADSGDSSDLERPMGEALRREAEAFAIVAHGTTGDVLHHPIELTTDGLRFADELARQHPGFQGFPISELLYQMNSGRIYDAGLLYNLVTRLPSRPPSDVDDFATAQSIMSDTQIAPEFSTLIRRVAKATVLADSEQLRARDRQLDSAMQAATARQLLDVLRHPAPAITAEIERLRGGIHEELLASVRAVLADQFNLVVTPDHVPVWDDLTTLLIAHR